ncbi:hypothetical protein [Devosia sp. A449]
MAIIFMTDPITGRCAIYDENGTSGAVDNPNSPRNAPLNNPSAHLDKLYFHSDLDYMETAFDPVNTTINHASIAAVTPSGGFSVDGGQITYDTTITSHVLATHGLGYVPDFMVVVDGDAMFPGWPVQYLGDGRARYLSARATTTQIILEERSGRTSNAIPAISKTYTVLVFRRPPAPSGNVLIDYDPTSEEVSLGRGKFNSSRRYLQIGSNGTPYGFAQGRTIDLKNGAPRLVDADGTITDIVPAAAAFAFSGSLQTSGWIFGPSAAYNGSFTGGPAIQVRVP